MKAELEMDCSDLEPGATRRMLCPKCSGGSSRERTLNVTRTEEGALLFLCWRASCDARGVVGGSPTRIASLVRTRETRFKVRTDPSERFTAIDTAPSAVWRDWKWQVFLDGLYDFGSKWDAETQRLALPVYSPVGRIRGYVLRALGPRPDGGPKTLAVPTLAEPQLGWNKQQGTTVVVVEDTPSAIRLGEFGVRAVALNGTHMTDEAKDELITEAENVVFALDRDAFAKAQRLETELRIHFNQTATLLLPKDFKNQTNEELEECLSQIPWVLWRMPEPSANALTPEPTTPGTENGA